MNKPSIFFCLLLSALACACSSRGGGSSTTSGKVASGPRQVRVSWAANGEKAVNSAGGGYNVYYSSTSGFGVPGGTLINIPFVSGSTPTSTTLTLNPGTYYFRIAAYSTLKALSGASSQLAITVP